MSFYLNEDDDQGFNDDNYNYSEQKGDSYLIKKKIVIQQKRKQILKKKVEGYSDRKEST